MGDQLISGQLAVSQSQNLALLVDGVEIFSSLWCAPSRRLGGRPFRDDSPCSSVKSPWCSPDLLISSGPLQTASPSPSLIVHANQVGVVVAVEVLCVGVSGVFGV